MIQYSTTAHEFQGRLNVEAEFEQVKHKSLVLEVPGCGMSIAEPQHVNILRHLLMTCFVVWIGVRPSANGAPPFQPWAPPRESSVNQP